MWLCVCVQNLSPHQLPHRVMLPLCHVTWHPRFHGYSIAHLQVPHLASHGFDGAGAFVAHLTAVALVEALLTWREKLGPLGMEKHPRVILRDGTPPKKNRKVGHLDFFSRKKHENQPTNILEICVCLFGGHYTPCQWLICVYRVCPLGWSHSSRKQLLSGNVT